jgi:hypothetical protein
LEFFHSYWNNTDSSFVFECKNLGKIKSCSFSQSINEYIYVDYKKDGGMYRYFTGKYSYDMNFGGMIGFIIGSTGVPIISKLIEKINEVYDSNSIGKLAYPIIQNSIFNNKNTFDSIHIRKNYQTNEDEEFTLHHIIMDFVNFSE